MNKFLGSGYISIEPELRCTSSGKKVCNFTLAIRRTKEMSDFLPVICWESTADFVVKYFHKGSRIEVEGHLQQRKWTDSDGTNHSRIEVIAENIGFGERAVAKENEMQEVSGNDGLELPNLP